MAIFQLINTLNEIQIDLLCKACNGSNLRKHADGAISFDVEFLTPAATNALAHYISLHPLQFWSCRPNIAEAGIIVTITNAI